ncbi:MAG: ParB/RepB/Spo0J family partition protein [Clostridia bacterium]|nr:ParB/RepB/Spo0J family partition protein [Clostridia bacterium]
MALGKSGLGKGLDALFPSNVDIQNLGQTIKKTDDGVIELKLNEIEPDINQPRKTFDDEKLQELAESIKEHGVIQPIIVSKKDEYYQIIAGERRWRASKKAGLKTIPAIIRDYDEKKIREISLIENIQRQNLNPIETAKAIKELMEIHEMTQEDIAKTLGKSRSTIANTLRVLNLDERVQEMIESGQISEGHARTLASIESPAKQYKLALDIINMDLSVRDAENYAKSKKEGKEFKKTTPKKGKLEIICQDIENEMKRVLGTKVTLNAATKSRGKIIIEYFSSDELDRILEIMGIEY